ncbi:MAG: cytidine deaminase [Alloprevotella sp.]|nr:cytidine deaminase [Prevotellamassilia sp.]MDY2623138.1 cytidine deaminase [Alloprevotella sp.]MDD7564117.1 cytidine deaminase [Prevotellamassilia sp.]MDY2778482.1 cytidine deaminase [Alloprevotella sp.]MDY4059691.1 cytidine deaminase [Alloprevotella sp.]
MTDKTLTIAYRSLQLDELAETDRQLIDAAISATETSYAPYSHFCVGAAVRLESGVVVVGSNQENVAFPSGTCAERCAMFYAGSRHPHEAPETIAIAARGTDGRLTPRPISPCGACRQVLLQAETRFGRRLRVLLYGSQEVIEISGVSDLLPFEFVDF